MLGIVYPKYWFAFFSIQFVDIFSHIAALILSNYRFYLSFYHALNSVNHFDDLASIKANVYSQLGLEWNQSVKSNATASSISSDDSVVHNWDFIYAQFVYTVWITSDIFFWTIYFAAFVSKQATFNKIVTDTGSNSNSSLNSLRQSPFYIISALDDLEQFFEANLKRFRLFIWTKKLLNFKLAFRVFCFICLLGAVFKFYFNFKSLMMSLAELIMIEDYFKGIP